MLVELKRAVRYRPWVSGHAVLLLNQEFDRECKARQGFSDEDHLRAAAHWLAAAQDSQSDGGIAGRYQLDRGWTSSYPETTGYIVPTFLALSGVLPESGFRERAERAVQFLLSVQLPDGGFPGLEIAANRTIPSAFNTGQILHGLTTWDRETGDERAHHAARRAAQWLLSVQDPDGAFRRHTYKDSACTYSAHLACWLAEWGEHAADSAATAAAGRHLDWTLGHRRPNDWIALAGFEEEQHRADEAFTHSIAYTLAGILSAAETLGRRDGVVAAEAAAERLARRLELSRFLPGLIGSDWKGRSHYGCLTGNCQMALIWFRLHTLSGNLRLVNAALKAIDLVKLAQPMRNANPGLSGGIPGSDPIHGTYIEGAFPNWAAKFFIDALLEKRRVLSLETETTSRAAVSGASSGPIVSEVKSGPARRLNTVMLTTIGSRKVPQMLTAWPERDLGNLTVVVERPAQEPLFARLRRRIQNEGMSWIAARLRAALSSHSAAPVAMIPDVLTFCRSRGVAVVETGPLEGDDAVTAIKDLKPDLGIHAGAGLLRRPLIDCFRLGILNAHMGLLPAFRGVNVTEWAALEKAAVGCTVHLIDSGVDTGSILARREVDIAGCDTIASLRSAVDDAQLELLGAVIGSITDGRVPEPLAPSGPPGRQYFYMHDELLAILAARLINKPPAAPQRGGEGENRRILAGSITAGITKILPPASGSWSEAPTMPRKSRRLIRRETAARPRA
jgi:folate-dependent phosphoribosylglycinamide formyltransferase PurN